MQHIHVRNVFQLFIPLSPAGNENKFSVTHLPGSNIGLTLHNSETNEYLQYYLRLYSTFPDTAKTEQDQSIALVWAKRNSYQLHSDGNNLGIILKLKLQHHVFDFRRVKKTTIRFHINCFSSGVLIGQATSSSVVLLPKKRQATAIDFSDEVTIPMVWMQELQPTTEDAQNSTIGDNKLLSEALSLEDGSIQYIMPWNSDLEAQSIQHIGEYPTDYAIDNYDHTSNDNEQYMVLYNGNAEVIGNFRALNFYKASDVRIKEDIRLLSEDRDSRSVLLKIDGVEYKFKRGVTSETQRKFVGFIAQQIEAVVPEAVQLIDGVLHVDYQSIIPYLSESIKQNFNDIKSGTSEREQIKLTVDLLYDEYLLREKKRDDIQQTPKPSTLESQRPQIRSRSLARILLYVIISAAIISSLAIGAYFVYTKIYPGNNPPSTDPEPLAPSFNTETDRKALIEFYIATNGGSWNSSTNWVTEAATCQWYGITCSNDNRVVGIALENNCVSGALPESIGKLDQLKKLQLKYNYLSGTIPNSLGRLPNLETLTLDQAAPRLNGTIPEFTSNYLQSVSISNAQFSEQKFPDWLQDKYALIFLKLNSVNLTGTIPAWISNLKSLQKLYLESNLLTGVIPSLPASLDTVVLARNQFTGDVPEFTNPKFSQLDLSNNALNGNMDKLITLPAILELYLQNNSLQGSVALSASALNGLQVMDLSHNRLEFAAADLSQPLNIQQCSAVANNFKCPIPQWLIKSCNATCAQ